MKSGRLHLVFHGRIPSEKAAALFAAESALAFQQCGIETHLIAPRRLGRSRSALQEYYGLAEPVMVQYLPTLDLFKIPIMRRVAFWVSYVVFSMAVLGYVLFYVRKGDVVYTNEALPALVASFVHRSVVYELHDFPEKSLWLYRAVFRRVRRIVTTNQWKQQQLMSRFGVSAEKIVVELNAVNVEQFNSVETRQEAREKLGLPQEARIVLYTGHLYRWKGVDTLAEAARLLPEYEVYFVGGTTDDVARFRENYKQSTNVHMVGNRPHHEVPLWQRAANVLVLPNTGKEDISRYYTSPMKLFEYMASGTPIVASRLRSIEEVVSEQEVLFVEPDKPDVLASGIVAAVNQDSSTRTVAANKKAQRHTWKGRASRIVDNI